MINEARMRMVMVGNGAALVALMGLTACGGSKGSGGQDGGDGGNGNCPPQTAPALMCTPGVSPANPLITDFTDGGGWCASSGKWGTTGNLVGSLFSYKGPMTGTMISHAVTSGALHLKGDVMVADYAGGGMAFDACVNTQTYSGLQFVLSGNAAGCNVQVQVQTYSQQVTQNRGGCSSEDGGTCFQFPKLSFLPLDAGTTSVLWTDLESTGMPATAAGIAAEIVGVQFQLQAESGAACMGFDVSVDDLRFIPR